MFRRPFSNFSIAFTSNGKAVDTLTCVAGVRDDPGAGPRLPRVALPPGDAGRGAVQVLYCTAPYCTVLYCTVLYCTVLYIVSLYCRITKTCDYAFSRENFFHEHVALAFPADSPWVSRWDTDQSIEIEKTIYSIFNISSQ